MADRESFEIAIGSVRLDPLEAGEELKEFIAASQSEDEEAREERAGISEPWIVQFHSALAENEIARMRAQFGLRLTEYVPNLAYVEQLTMDVVAGLRDDPLVRAALAYRPEFKLLPSLNAETAPSSREADESGGQPVRLVLFDDVELGRATAEITGAGLVHLRVLDDRPLGGPVRVLATAPNRDSIRAVSRVPWVRWIEPVRPLVMDNVGAAATIQSGDAGNPVIWDQGLRGQGQVIGIIDEGLPDIEHCYFRDPVNDSAGQAHRKILDLRIVDDSPPNLHSTFVAGCAVGDDIENPGAAAHRGGAWAAKLVAGSAPSGLAGTMINELALAAIAGAKIHSNSWHEKSAEPGEPAIYTEVAADVDRFTWMAEDHLVLGAAGNVDRLTGDFTEQGPPGTAKNAICVSAAQADPDELTLGNGNPGPTADGRRKPDLVTVGCGIESAVANTDCETSTFGVTCATSSATPHAAAAAALVRQYFTEGWYPTGRKEAGHSMNPTGALLKAVLLACTIDMAGPDYPNDREGFGLVQLHRGLHFFDTGGPLRLQVFDVRHEKGLSTDVSQSRSVEVTAAVQPLKFVLAYSDAPGLPGTSGGLVNDLNLVVTGPDGSKFLGNHFVNGESATGGVADDKNNVEVVLLSTPQAGNYTITVIGPRVSRPRQGYALAVLGSLNLKSCFVASAVYGNSEHPDVQALRDWRDTHLAPGAPGRAAMQTLVRAYALLGPPMARLVGAHPRLATLVRERVLAPFVAWLNGKANRRCF